MSRFWIATATTLWLVTTVLAAEPEGPGRRPRPGQGGFLGRPAEVTPGSSAPAAPYTDRDAPRPSRPLELDPNRPLGMVRLEVLIGDVPGKAGKPAEAATKASTEDLRRQMEVVACGELTAVDNQPAFIRLGRREARITATTTGAMGTTNAITFENVGTSLGLVSRVAADGTVFVQLDVSDSHLGPPEEGPPIAVPSKGETIRTPNTETFSTQTTLHLRDGQTLVAGGMGWQAKSGKQRLVLVTAHVLDKGTTEGRDRPRQRE